MSPELALVDPLLAERLRALDPEPLWVAPRHAPAEAAVPAARPARYARPGYLAVAWLAVVLAPVAALANVRLPHDEPLPVAKAPAPLLRSAEGSVERALPAALTTSTARSPELRPVLDPATGLLRSGTGIRCRLLASGRFSCTLSAPRGGRATVVVRRSTAGVTIVRG